jgi:hypothetical protein
LLPRTPPHAPYKKILIPIVKIILNNENLHVKASKLGNGAATVLLGVLALALDVVLGELAAIDGGGQFGVLEVTTGFNTCLELLKPTYCGIRPMPLTESRVRRRDVSTTVLAESGVGRCAAVGYVLRDR